MEGQQELLQQLRTHITEIDNAWEQMSGKLSMCMQLSSEQTKFLGTYQQYSDAWQKYVAFGDETEVHPQVHILMEAFYKVKEKTKNAENIIDSFIKRRQRHMNRIQTALKIVSAAQSPQDLASISIPTLDWLHTRPDPNVEEPAADWSKLGLQSKLDLFLAQLQNLIQVESGNAFNSDLAGGVSPRKRKRSD